MSDKGLARIAEGIAFAALCGAAAWLEVSGKPASGLWVIIVIWAFLLRVSGQSPEDL